MSERRGTAAGDVDVSAAQGAERGPAAMPRARVVAEAWLELGPAVAALSNAGGHPLARTVKLILDPLVIRPAQHPRLAAGALDPEAAAELQGRITGAASDLAATAAWFTELKRARRRAAITEGNPQDLYFQRCYELARSHGSPDQLPDHEAIADATVAEMRRPGDELTVPRIREYLRAQEDELNEALRAAWIAAATDTGDDPDPAEIASALGSPPGPSPDAESERRAFDALVASRSGTSVGARLGGPGTAAALGLSDRERPGMPPLGDTASKRNLPKPFDRSVFERLFAAIAALRETRAADDVPRVVHEEIDRCASAWQLAEEASRVAMVLGAEASRTLGAQEGGAGRAGDTPVQRRLRERWEREAYVRRVRRLPALVDEAAVPPETIADVAGVRGAYLRRLWARLHGKELRETPILAGDLDDTLEGVLRSVVLDHRHRLKRALSRGLAGEAAA